jgi:hypothetical protein
MTDAPDPPVPVLRRRRPLPLRLAVTALEAVGALAGLVMLAAALLAIRLAWGPLEVDFLTPALIQVLNDEADPLKVSFGATSVSWGAGRATVDLIANDLHLVDPAGTSVMTLPRLAVSLSVPSLLEGRLAPTRLTASGARIHLVRSADGTLGLVASAAPAEAETGQSDDTGEPWPQMLRGLAGKEAADGPIADLHEVAVDGLDLTVDDRANGVVLHLRQGHAGVTRQANGLDISLGGQLGLAGLGTKIETMIHLDTEQRTATLDTAFDALDPAALATSLPAAPSWLEGVHLAISGHLTGALDVGTMQLGAASLRLRSAAGSVTDPHLAGGHLDLSGIDIDADYDPIRRRLDLTRAALDLGGTSIFVSGQLQPAGSTGLVGAGAAGPMVAKGHIELRNLKLDRFAQVWPPGVAGDARAWIVENLSVGRVDLLKADGEALYDPSAAEPVTLRSYSGTMNLSDVTVDYLSGLPRLEGVNGTLTASPQRLDLSVNGGRMQGEALTVPDGAITIDGFDQPFQRITIDLGLRGPAHDVMQVLDAKRLRYATAIGLTPDRITGSVDGTLHFRMPLKKDLPFSEVEYGAHATLDGLSITEVALGKDLTEGHFKLDLDHDHVTLDGTGRLDGVPATVKFMQRIGGSAGYRSEAVVRGTIDQPARHRFDLDLLPDIITGPVGLNLDYRLLDERHAEAAVTLDLTPADLAIDLAGWTKPAGTAGTASFLVAFDQGHVTALTGLDAAAPDLNVKGALQLADGRITHARIDRFQALDADVAGTIDHGDVGQPWVVKLHGPHLDFLPIRKQLASSDKAPDTDPGPPLAIEAHLDRLLNGPDRALSDATVKVALARHTFLSGSLTARLGQAGTLDFHLDPAESGGKFALQTTDFGAFFNVMRITDKLVGGSLSVTGSSHQEGPGRRFTGHADGKDYRLQDMPFMARLLSLASFQTVASLLSGQGIPFTTLKADLSLQDGRLTVTHGRAYGGAIGVTAEGWIDTRVGTLDLDGSLVPAYTLNNALGNLPLLGPLLIGEEGGGLFAANVGVYGQLAEPTISINPLSVVAPGIIRNLFLFDAPGPGIGPEKPAKPK